MYLLMEDVYGAGQALRKKSIKPDHPSQSTCGNGQDGGFLTGAEILITKR